MKVDRRTFIKATGAAAVGAALPAAPAAAASIQGTHAVVGTVVLADASPVALSDAALEELTAAARDMANYLDRRAYAQYVVTRGGDFPLIAPVRCERCGCAPGDWPFEDVCCETCEECEGSGKHPLDPPDHDCAFCEGEGYNTNW